MATAGPVDRLDDALAYLNVLAVVLGTIGSVGTLFNFWVTPMIRCYNRISIFIAFFALAGLFLFIEKCVRRYVKEGRASRYTLCFLPVFSCWESTTKLPRELSPPIKKRKASTPPTPTSAGAWRRCCPPDRWSGRCRSFPIRRPPPSTISGLSVAPSLPAHEDPALELWSHERPGNQPLARSAPPTAAGGRTETRFRGIRGNLSGSSWVHRHGAAVEKQLARLLGVDPLVSLTSGTSSST